MRLGYEILACCIVLYYSGAAAAQLKSPFPRQVQILNTTTSSPSFPITNPTNDSTTTFDTTSNSTTSVCTPLTTQDETGSSCISYCTTLTFFSFDTNATSTTTAYLTIYGNSTSFPQTTQSVPPPPITTLPPQPCPTRPFHCRVCHKPPPPPATISLITSKTSTVTSLVTLPPQVCFACADDPIGKVPVNNAAVSPTTAPPAKPSPYPDSLQDQAPQHPTPNPWVPANPTDGNPSSPTTVTVNGITIGLPGSGSNVVIDGTPIATSDGAGGGTATVTADGGQVFTINPSQIIGPGTTIARHIAAASEPTPTVVDGVTLAIGPSIAVVDGTSYAITPGATPTEIVVNGVPVSIGAAGVGLPATTIQPASLVVGFGRVAGATQLITAGGVTFTEIGPSLVVIGGSTFTIGPGASPTTDVVNGKTVSIGPGGVGFASTTVLYSTGAGGATPMQVSAGGGRYSRHGEIWVMGVLVVVWFLL